MTACSKNQNVTVNGVLKSGCWAKNNYAECCVHDPQLYYFYRTALEISSNLEDGGTGMNGKLAGCLILSWVLVYCCVVKGVKSSGKV